MKKPHIPLETLQAQAMACHACPLADGRTNVVFGTGNPPRYLRVRGRSAGKNEDLQGVPFVGAAGQYLNELLAYAGLRREDVYIANVLKCRPPGNRNPLPSEIEVCTPFLREQTRTIDPLFIVTLGNFATKFILKTDRGITGLHGKLYQTGKFKVFPVFHPAAAIYDRRKRTDLEDDFATLGEYLLQEGIVARTPQSVVREAEAHARAQAAGAAVPGASAAPGASGGLEAAGLGDAPVDSAPGAVESAAPESSTSHAGEQESLLL